ncbi:MAG: hypothetical protein ACSLE7_16895, partial [Mycobacterium sp.]
MTSLGGARCVNSAELYARTVAEQGQPANRPQVQQARTAALRICAGCPALDRCRAWLDRLPINRRPRGVVAGAVVRADGRIVAIDPT